MDVAKVDRDVSYVTMVVHLCYKRPFSMFHLSFSDVCCKCVYLEVAYASRICCKCFYLDVAYVLQRFSSVSVCFLCVQNACFKCFICL
jgi:energy-converting hydrogenase Eha subunit C